MKKIETNVKIDYATKSEAKNFAFYLFTFVLLLGVLWILLAGCNGLRFAPSEQQKQNAWLHNRTATFAAQAAKNEQASEKLQALTGLSELQSQAFTSYFGLPGEFPQAGSAEQVLAESNWQLAHTALQQSGERPDAWQVADSAMELGIGICALLGGVYGTRAVQFLKEAKTKSKALKEIIDGNELFKKTSPSQAAAFKEAQQNQSPETKQIVVQMKNS